MALNSVLTTAIIGGVVAIVVATVGIVPNFGRLRRLERIVDIISKVDDDAGRQRLLAIRDRYIASLQPGRWRDQRLYIVGLVVFAVGFTTVLVTLVFSLRTPHFDQGLVPAISSVVLTTVGFLVAILAQNRIRRDRQEFADAMDAVLAQLDKEAETARADAEQLARTLRTSETPDEPKMDD